MMPRSDRPVAWGVVLAVAATASTLSGCMTAYVVRESLGSPKLELIKSGTSRSVVEKELGKPVRSEHNVATYEYFMSSGSTGNLLMTPISALLDLSGASLFVAPQMLRKHRLGTSQMEIVYGPGDKVIGLTHSGSRRVFQDWMEDNERESKLEKLDYAANTGYAAAQMVQATRYRYGLWKSEADPVRAHVWARLAELGGHPAARETLAAWARTMSPAQLSDAERRYHAWEPEIPVEIRTTEPAALPPLDPNALAHALADAASRGELAGGPLGVLVIGMDRTQILRPAIINVDNMESAAGAVARLVQSNFTVAVPVASPARTQPQTSIKWVCMIARDGSRFELNFARDGSMRGMTRERVSPAFRSEVMAVMGNKAAYQGGYVCGLQVAEDWPTDLRSKIVAFAEGIESR